MTVKIMAFKIYSTFLLSKNENNEYCNDDQSTLYSSLACINFIKEQVNAKSYYGIEYWEEVEKELKNITT